MTSFVAAQSSEYRLRGLPSNTTSARHIGHTTLIPFFGIYVYNIQHLCVAMISGMIILLSERNVVCKKVQTKSKHKAVYFGSPKYKELKGPRLEWLKSRRDANETTQMFTSTDFILC